MFVVEGIRVVTRVGRVTKDDSTDTTFLVSDEGGWLEIGKGVFYHKEEAELKAEKNRQASIVYHEKALEELRRKNP